MAKITLPTSEIEKAYSNMINEEIEELKSWRRQNYTRHKKTFSPDEHAAIDRNINQIINLLKQKAK